MSKFGVVVHDKTQFTVDTLKDKFPEKKKTITPELVDMLNAANNDPSFNGDEFIEQMITYKSIMLDGQHSFKDYINALKFCAFLEATDNATEAYKKARATDQFVIERANAPTDSVGYRELTSVASRYRRDSMLVKKILTQSDMPLYLMFQGARYKAVTVLANEMETAPLSRDRISAAKELLANVKPPENVQVEIGIGPNQEAKDLSKQLSEQLADSVQMQRKLLEAGMSLDEATKTGIDLNGTAPIEDAEIIDG